MKILIRDHSMPPVLNKVLQNEYNTRETWLKLTSKAASNIHHFARIEQVTATAMATASRGGGVFTPFPRNHLFKYSRPKIKDRPFRLRCPRSNQMYYVYQIYSGR